jgi:hypothetical protein
MDRPSKDHQTKASLRRITPFQYGNGYLSA